jgi:hypothetical protein
MITSSGQVPVARDERLACRRRLADRPGSRGVLAYRAKTCGGRQRRGVKKPRNVKSLPAGVVAVQVVMSRACFARGYR